MRHFRRMLLVTWLCSAALLAQPVVDSVLNPASYALPGMPNYGIAQGGLFVAFGRNLGPSGWNEVKLFPLPTVFNGISIRVTVGGTSVDCLVMNSYGAGSTPATQVVGLLPSSTPIGDGTLVLTYNGQRSTPAPIKVVRRAFGMVTLNSAGSGPAVITDAGYRVKLITEAAHPGQAVVLWGTGLGAISGDERQPAPGGDMTNVDVKVYVGDREATVFYRGRTPGAAGLDQINFYVPGGVNGCYLPLVVYVEGIPSNWATLPVAPEGNNFCSEQNGLSGAEIQAASERGSLGVGNVFLYRMSQTMTVPQFGSITTTMDMAEAEFGRYDLQGLIRFRGTQMFGDVGSCTVLQFAGEENPDMDPIQPQPLDAGPALTLNGPKGQKQIPREDPGYYSAILGQITGFGQGDTPLFLDPGSYTVTGPGGPNVGQFTTTQTFPGNFTWQNRDSINNIPRNQDLRVTWTNAAAGGQVVLYGLSAISTPIQAGAVFFCVAQSSAGQLTVPARILSALPASGVEDGIPMGQLMLGTMSAPARFNATGLDYGYFSSVVVDGKLVAFN